MTMSSVPSFADTCKIEPQIDALLKETYTVTFSKSMRAIAPGQVLAVYQLGDTDDDTMEVLGSCYMLRGTS